MILISVIVDSNIKNISNSNFKLEKKSFIKMKNKSKDHASLRQCI